MRDMLLYYMYKASRCQTNCYINQVKALNFTSMMFLYTFIFIIFIRYTLLNIITLLSVEFNFFFLKDAITYISMLWYSYPYIDRAHQTLTDTT